MIERLFKIERPNTEILADGGKGKEQTSPAALPEEKDSNKKQHESGEERVPTTKEGGEYKEGNDEDGKQKAAGI